MEKIGQFIKRKRLELNLGLREFCELAAVDPSNWSKIERDMIKFSYGNEKIEHISKVLRFEKDSEDYLTLYDLAFIAKGQIPEYVYSDEVLLKSLPAFFRTFENEKPTAEKLDKLVEVLKRGLNG